MVKKMTMVLFALVLLLSCATSPMGRRQFVLLDDSQMDEMGVQAFDNIKQETPIEHDPQLNQYVNCITQAIVQVYQHAATPWEIVVFRDKTANAFALPGGKVGVYTGMLEIADNQDRLATVIGHEIAHVLSKHGNERVSQQFAVEQGLALVQAIAQPTTQQGQTLMGLLGVGATVGVLLPYSRIQESEADKMGLNLMANAGFNPQESVALWQKMSQQGEEVPEFLSTHPAHATRIKELQNAMSQAMQLYQQAQAGNKRPYCSL